MNKSTKVFPDFLNELKAIDERLDIITNPNLPGLSNIKFMGADICPIPSDVIYDEPNPSYTFTFANGVSYRHKSRNEALGQVKDVLRLVENEDNLDAFLGRGKYK